MRERGESTLLDVLDRVLDKGIVIDAHVRIGVVGVELISVEARVVVASIETYLAHADAIAYTASAARRAVPAALEVEPVAVLPPLFVQPVEPAAASRGAASPDEPAPATPADAADPAQPLPPG